MAPYPYACGPPGLKILLVGSPFHLIHHFLNHPYPPKGYKYSLTLHGLDEESYAAALKFWPNIG